MGERFVNLSRYQRLFRDYRKDRAVTATQVARELGLNPSTLCPYAHGDKVDFLPEVAFKIGRLLGRDVRELRNFAGWDRYGHLFGDHPEPPPLGDNVRLFLPPFQHQFPLFVRGRSASNARGAIGRRAVATGATTLAEQPRVFISYATPDGIDFAELVENKLHIAGFNPWRDQSSLKAGDPWAETIRRTIASCAVLLVVITAGAERSSQLGWEVGLADAHRVPVIPLRRHAEVGILPQVEGYQEVSFVDGKDRPWDRLFEEILRLAPQLRTHRNGAPA